MPTTETAPGLYDELVAMGAEISNHYSDLYVKASPEVLALLNKHGAPVKPFRGNMDGLTWYDVPFAYDPYWTARGCAHV